MRKTVLLVLSVLYSAGVSAQSFTASLFSENGLSVVLGFLLVLTILRSYWRKKKDQTQRQQQEEAVLRQEEEMSHLSLELEAKTISLDLLNKKLLSEMAKREELEKTAFARDHFLANMGNEMRTPLNAITGLAHHLLAQEPREDQVEQLRNLQFAANDLVVYLNDILDFSKIEAGKLHFEDRPFNMSRLLREVEQKFHHRAAEKNLQFHYQQDAAIPEELLGDEACTVQILSNLLQNSLRQTENGNIRLEVALLKMEGTEALLEFTVEWTDSSIHRSVIERMFQAYNDVESERSGYNSQQFSLAITKRLVELQNGKMDVQVAAGESTRFKVWLPFLLATTNGARHRNHEPPKMAGLEGTRVLLVDDNKINQLVVSKMLKRAGMDVSQVSDGLEAVKAVEENDFDLILMDIQMPGMDGYRATAEIRRHQIARKRETPIIALTASAFLSEKEKAVLFGMNDHVGKPFSPAELMGKIYKCLRVHSK